MENNKNSNNCLAKLPTYIPGFDIISNGGLPKNRITLLAGSAGSAKTIFTCQFLAEGVKNNEKGVFVTFEESVGDIRANIKSFGWDIEAWEANNMWAFVDASPTINDSALITGDFDLGALMARIEHTVTKIGATRVCLDSFGSIFSRFDHHNSLRRELIRLTYALKELNVTVILTAERTQEYGPIARHEVEEFVLDNVIILRNVLEFEKRRRTIEILKFRGSNHQKGEYPFTIHENKGIVMIPLSAIELKQESSDYRISSGNKQLDNMCGGGFFRDSIILVSGATGTGKTLIGTTFVATDSKDRNLVLAFEESREQLTRNAAGWGKDFETMEKEGSLRMVCKYPETASLEEHLVTIQNEIEQFRPTRIVLDSLSALERISSLKSFREFVVGLTSFVKKQQITGIFTSTTPSLMGGTSITEANISTITDSIIVLRYVEMYGEMKRGLAVLKMRGATHDKSIREYTIDSDGIHIGKPFKNISGILSGNVVHVPKNETERIEEMFTEENEA